MGTHDGHDHGGGPRSRERERDTERPSVVAGSDGSSRLLSDGGQVVEEEAETDEDEAADHEQEDEGEGEDEGEDVSDEQDEMVDDKTEGEHGGDAEDVYESDDASGVIHLDLDGLFLDVLGLEVNLNEVTLDVSARPGENNLLGNLLSTVTGLFDSISSPFEAVKNGLGSMKGALLGAIPGIGETTGDDEEDADERERAGILSRIGGWFRGLGSSVAGWFQRRLAGLVSKLPLEQLIARITREVLQQLVDRAESVSERAKEATPEAEQQAESGGQTEATS